MNFLSLNVNGLGKGEFKSKWVRNIILSNRIDFVGLQETKRKKWNDKMLKDIWGSHDFEAVFKEAAGQGGGMLCMWNKNLFTKTQTILRNDCILIKGRWTESNEEICIINIYGSQKPEERKDLWNFISAYLLNWKGKSIIFGDFNEVRSEKERRGSIFDKRSAEAFNDFIRNNRLEDLKIGGREFTWSNKSCSKLSKLDRFLIS